MTLAHLTSGHSSMSTGLQEVVQARRLHSSLALSHRLAPSSLSQSLAEVYGLSASAALISDPLGSGFSHQLSSTSLWSPSTLPGWWEAPGMRHAVDKHALIKPSVLMATHEVKAKRSQDCELISVGSSHLNIRCIHRTAAGFLLPCQDTGMGSFRQPRSQSAMLTQEQLPGRGSCRPQAQKLISCVCRLRSKQRSVHGFTVPTVLMFFLSK